MTTNERVAKMLEAMSKKNMAQAPHGFVSRRDIEDALNCSEATATRIIRKMQKQKDFKKVTIKVDGKNVHYYKCSYESVP